MTRSDAGAKPREGCDSVAWEIADQVRDEGKGWSVFRWSAVSCPYAVCGNAKTQLGWVRGPGRHGGEAPALCVGTDDVGLDSLVRSYQEERTNIKAALDVRHLTCPRWHDMAAAMAKTALCGGNTPHTPRRSPCEAAFLRCALAGA